jgi:single-stranded DNA-binding protein
MSLHLLVSGQLIADPQRRQGAKAAFVTATVRAGAGDDTTLVNVIAFADQAERLLGLAKGAPVAVSGRAELKRWTGKDGAERTGLSVVASEIAALKPRPRRRSDEPRAPSQRWDGAGGDRRPLDDPLPAEWSER